MSGMEVMTTTTLSSVVPMTMDAAGDDDTFTGGADDDDDAFSGDRRRFRDIRKNIYRIVTHRICEIYCHDLLI